MRQEAPKRTWLLAASVLATDLLCYFGFPVWAGLPPLHPLLPYVALALLVGHLVVLYFVVRWWLGGTWEEVSVPTRWSWRRLWGPAGLALALVLVASAVPQIYLMRWPITSGDDEALHVMYQLWYFNGLAHPSGGWGVTLLFGAVIVGAIGLAVYLVRNRTRSGAGEGAESATSGGWRPRILVLSIGASLLLGHIATGPLVASWGLPHRWPPLGTILAALSHAALGVNEVAARGPALLFYLLTAVYVFRIVAGEFDEWVAVVAAGCCLVSPAFFKYGHLSFVDEGGAFFLTAGVFYALRHMRFGNRADVGYAALSAALGYLERRPAALLIGIVAVGLLFASVLGSERPRRFRAREAVRVYGGAFVVAMLLILPWAVRSINTRPYPLSVANWIRWDVAICHLRILPDAVGWPVAILFALGAAIALVRRRVLDCLALTWFAAIYVFFTSLDPVWLPCRRFMPHFVPVVAILAVRPFRSVSVRNVRHLACVAGALCVAAMPLVSWLTDTPVAHTLPRRAPTLMDETYFPFDQVVRWFQQQGVREATVMPPAFWQTAMSAYVVMYGLSDSLEVRNPPWTPGHRAPRNIEELLNRCRREGADYLVTPEVPRGPEPPDARFTWVRVGGAPIEWQEYALLASDRAEGFTYVDSFVGHGRRLVLSRVHDEPPGVHGAAAAD